MVELSVPKTIFIEWSDLSEDQQQRIQEKINEINAILKEAELTSC